MQQDQRAADDSDRELHDRPVVLKEPPWSAQGLDNSRDKGSERQWHDDRPAYDVHCSVDPARLLDITGVQTSDGESEKAKHSAEPAERAADVDRQSCAAKPRRHGLATTRRLISRSALSAVRPFGSLALLG